MLIRAILIYLILFFSSLNAASTSGYAESENVYLNSIDNEFIKAKLKYGDQDAILFKDIQEVKISISLDSSYTEAEKLRFYEILFSFVKDINVNIHAGKKMDEFDYRRVIRFLPSVFHYIHENKLTEFLTQYPNEAIKTIAYLHHEDGAKTALAQIGLDNPSLFYNNVEELSGFKYFTSIFIYLGVYDPVNWLAQISKNSILSDIAYQSSNPIIKKILEIKDRLGSTTNVFFLLDEVVRNSFNDSHEVDFISDKDHLTKKVLEAAINAEAYGNMSSLNALPIVSKWLFEQYIEGTESVLSDYSNNHIFLAMAMCHSILEYDDFISLLSFMKKMMPISSPSAP